MAHFIEAEEIVRKYFTKGTTFDYAGTKFTVKDSGKPSPQKGKGEPKTEYMCLLRVTTRLKSLKYHIRKKMQIFLKTR